MLKNYLRLNLSLLYWVFVAPFTGQFFSISQIFRQMVFIVVRATSMVAFTSFYIGVLGGWAVCRFALSFNTAGYIMRALESADTWDLYSGMIKSVVFAWIVITIACNAGLHVEGGAEGVGQATTSSVVQALLAMLVTNAILTGIFFFGA